MRISDWSSDVCSSDLFARIAFGIFVGQLRTLRFHHRRAAVVFRRDQFDMRFLTTRLLLHGGVQFGVEVSETWGAFKHGRSFLKRSGGKSGRVFRSEEHMSELQSLMRISYAVFCLKKKNV